MALRSILLNFVCVLLLTTVGALADEDHRIPLKIFGQNVVDEYAGCSFALWQDDKDPEVDDYAYVFFAPIHDGGELPGWMKIGDKVYEMYRQDLSESGFGQVSPHQLYRSDDEDFWVIMDIMKQRLVGNDVIIDLAELTIIGSKKFPFVSVVKGKSGCPAELYANSTEQNDGQYTSLPGDVISLSFVDEVYDIAAVPIGIREYIVANYENCDLEFGAGYTARYAISDAMTLWHVPCATYAQSATSNFFITLNDNSNHFTPVFANHPADLAGFIDGDLKEMFNSTIEPSTGSIVSWEDHNQGDCGTFWKYQLRAVEGEAVEAFLVEFRRKDSCDGNFVAPENMPVVYLAK